jgi:uncharacterized membrane protein
MGLMGEDDARRIAEEAAERALERLLLRLGIDAEEAIEVQRDMTFVRNWRVSADTIKRQGLIVAVGVVVVGMLALIWNAIKGGP